MEWLYYGFDRITRVVFHDAEPGKFQKTFPAGDQISHGHLCGKMMKTNEHP